MPTFDVGIVGAGPTGLTVANLLGAAGVSTLVVERNASTSTEAKAISLDDESVRTLHRAGLGPWLQDVVMPGTGTRYYGRRGQLLYHARGPEPPLHGHAIKSPFAQPELEAALLAGLDRFDQVQVAFNTTLVDLHQEADSVEMGLHHQDGEETVRVRYLLGCDGGRSTVREKLGIGMRGSSFSQRWIVIDTVADDHDERYGLHFGTPGRPHVIIPGRSGRCRYEFLLRDEEALEEPVPFNWLAQLLASHRSLAPAQVERVAVYRFHALIAERWRARRCLLLGDAAHMMPPFAGQGLNTGIRDANNVSWRLVMLLRERAGDALLDSYEAERKPHAQDMIDLSVRLGQIVMTTSRLRAVTRDLLVQGAMKLPATRRYLEQMRFRPSQRYVAGFVSHIGRGRRRLLGEAMPQPHVLASEGRTPPLDEILGEGFALLAVDLEPETLGKLGHAGLWDDILIARRVRVSLDRFPSDGDGWVSVADYGGDLRRILAPFGGTYVLVRPDRFVAAIFEPEEAPRVAAEITRLLAYPPQPSRPLTTPDYIETTASEMTP